jgi:hypothetical protein
MEDEPSRFTMNERPARNKSVLLNRHQVALGCAPTYGHDEHAQPLLPAVAELFRRTSNFCLFNVLK